MASADASADASGSRRETVSRGSQIGAFRVPNFKGDPAGSLIKGLSNSDYFAFRSEREIIAFRVSRSDVGRNRDADADVFGTLQIRAFRVPNFKRDPAGSPIKRLSN